MKLAAVVWSLMALLMIGMLGVWTYTTWKVQQQEIGFCYSKESGANPAYKHEGKVVCLDGQYVPVRPYLIVEVSPDGK